MSDNYNMNMKALSLNGIDGAPRSRSGSRVSSHDARSSLDIDSSQPSSATPPSSDKHPGAPSAPDIHRTSSTGKSSYPFHHQIQQNSQPYHQHQQQQMLHSSSPNGSGILTPHSNSGTRPPQLNSDIQARIMAFQQKRTQSVNSPPLTASTSPSTQHVNLDTSDLRRLSQGRSSPVLDQSNKSQANSSAGQLNHHHSISNNYGNNSYNSSSNYSNYNNNNNNNNNSNTNNNNGSTKPLPPLPGSESASTSIKSMGKRTLSESHTHDISHDLLPSPIDHQPGDSFSSKQILAIQSLSSNPPVPDKYPQIQTNVSRLPGVAANPASPQTPVSSYPNNGISSPPVQSSPPSPQLSQQQAFELTKKKPSISQRRGMKLNMNMNELTRDLSEDVKSDSTQNSSNSADPSTNTSTGSNPVRGSPITFKSTGDLSRKLSERKNKPNFKLNMDSINNDLPDSKNNKNDSTDGGANKKPLQGLFANYSKYVDIKEGSLNFAGKASLHSKGVDFSSGNSFHISLDEFEYLDELGRGNYGCVSKVLHKPTNVVMAMKEVRLELDETKFTQILMELEILHKCDSPYIVDFYGAFFVEGAVYMCIEYMDGGSLEKIFGNSHGITDEACLAYISECVISGLKELKDRHNIIHRDVKPTNILINTQGKVKLCDFGVSGNLVASLAKTNIGCQSYMAPERIKSSNPDDASYSVQSDIWSLGLTILEVAAGIYPYPSETYGNIFSQLSAIVDGEPPKLDPLLYSKEAQMFVRSCLNKNPDLRPSYAALLNNPWLIKYRGVETNMSQLVDTRLQELESEKAKSSLSRSNSSKKPTFSATSMSSQSSSVSTNEVIPNKQARIANTPVTTAASDVPINIENVQSLLRSKVKPPALHRGGGLNNNRNFLNR